MRPLLPRVLTGLRARLVIGFLHRGGDRAGVDVRDAAAPARRLLRPAGAARTWAAGRAQVADLRSHGSCATSRPVARRPRPILQPTEPLTRRAGVRRRARTPDAGFVNELLPTSPRPTSPSRSRTDPEHPDQIVYQRRRAASRRMRASPASSARTYPGRRRPFTFSDQFWTQRRRGGAAAAGHGHPVRSVHVPRADARRPSSA